MLSKFILVCCGIASLLSGCVAIEGRASNVQFSVRTGNSSKEPSSSTIFRDLDRWAHAYGFVKVDNPPGERYEAASYILTLEQPKRIFHLNAGYAPGLRYREVLVGVSAPYRKLDQQFLNGMVDKLRQEVSYELHFP